MKMSLEQLVNLARERHATGLQISAGQVPFAYREGELIPLSNLHFNESDLRILLAPYMTGAEMEAAFAGPLTIQKEPGMLSLTLDRQPGQILLDFSAAVAGAFVKSPPPRAPRFDFEVRPGTMIVQDRARRISRSLPLPGGVGLFHASRLGYYYLIQEGMIYRGDPSSPPFALLAEGEMLAPSCPWGRALVFRKPGAQRAVTFRGQCDLDVAPESISASPDESYMAVVSVVPEFTDLSLYFVPGGHLTASFRYPPAPGARVWFITNSTLLLLLPFPDGPVYRLMSPGQAPRDLPFQPNEQLVFLDQTYIYTWNGSRYDRCPVGDPQPENVTDEVVWDCIAPSGCRAAMLEPDQPLILQYEEEQWPIFELWLPSARYSGRVPPGWTCAYAGERAYVSAPQQAKADPIYDW